MADTKLFLKNYSFFGKHADMVDKLTSVFDDKSGSRVFSSFIDLFITSAFVGVKNGHKAKPSVDKSRDKKILAEQFNSHSEDVRLAFKFVTLLGNAEQYDDVTRLNKAFRNPETDENYDQFEQYMLGGLEDIYNQIYSSDPKTYLDYLHSVNDFVNEYKTQQSEEDSPVPDSNDLFD